MDMLQNQIQLQQSFQKMLSIDDDALSSMDEQFQKVMYEIKNQNFREVSQKTIDMELEAGVQIANMLGFNTQASQYPCAWGHITSAGCTAKYDSLWNARAINCYPLALKAAAKKLQLDFIEHQQYNKKLIECTSWECQNHSVDAVLNLHFSVYEQLLNTGDLNLPKNYFNQVNMLRIEHLGMASFYAEHWDAKQPVILVPSTASDSWSKALKLLGFGSNQLIKIDLNHQMKMDINALERVLVHAEQKKIPILAVVAMLGTAEYGNIDPIHKIIQLRKHFLGKGMTFYFHVDASWGGYLSSIFRNNEYELISKNKLKNQFTSFPSDHIYDAFSKIHLADSVTVDPYKIGYLPFGTSAFICRNRDISYLTKGDVFMEGAPNSDVLLEHLRNYLLDGTKPGAIAVACCLSQRLLPLNNKNFGHYISKSIRACELLKEKIQDLKNKLKNKINLCIPFAIDTNILYITLNLSGNSNLLKMNHFNDYLFERLEKIISGDTQLEFFCSLESLTYNDLGGIDSKELIEKLGLEKNCFVLQPDGNENQSKHIKVLKHSLLRPGLLDCQDTEKLINLYLSKLERVILEILSKKELI